MIILCFLSPLKIKIKSNIIKNPIKFKFIGLYIIEINKQNEFA